MRKCTFLQDYRQSKQEEEGKDIRQKLNRKIDTKTAIIVISIVLFLIVIVACLILPEKRDVVSEIDGTGTSKYTTPEVTIANKDHTSISIYGEYITIYDEKYYLHRNDDTYLYLNVKDNGYDSRIQSVEIWLNGSRWQTYTIENFINEESIYISSYDKNTKINISVSYLNSEGTPITSEDYGDFWIKFANTDFYGTKKDNIGKSKGDVDGDGFVTYYDAELAINNGYILDGASLTSEQINMGDVDNNGYLTSQDAADIMYNVNGTNHDLNLQPGKVYAGDTLTFQIGAMGGTTSTWTNMISGIDVEVYNSTTRYSNKTTTNSNGQATLTFGTAGIYSLSVNGRTVRSITVVNRESDNQDDNNNKVTVKVNRKKMDITARGNAINEIKIYVNGQEETYYSAENEDTMFGSEPGPNYEQSFSPSSIVSWTETAMFPGNYVIEAIEVDGKTIRSDVIVIGEDLFIAPTISGVNYNGKYNTPQTVSFTDNYGTPTAVYYTSEYNYNLKKDPISFTSGKVFDQNGTYWIEVTDADQNKNSVKFTIDTIAPNKPIVQINGRAVSENSEDSPEYCNKNVVVTSLLNGNNLSEIEYINIQYDKWFGDCWELLNNTHTEDAESCQVAINEEGLFKIVASVRDNAGNMSFFEVYLCIDTTKPNKPIVQINGRAVSENSEDSPEYCNKNVVVTSLLNGNNLSEIEYINIQYDKWFGDCWELLNNTHTEDAESCQVAINEEGLFKIVASVRDNAGNMSDFEVYLCIDTTKPVISQNTNEDKTVKVNVDDSLSGINKVTYKKSATNDFTGVQEIDCTQEIRNGGKTFSENGYYKVKATDKAGNEAESQVIYIDKNTDVDTEIPGGVEDNQSQEVDPSNPNNPTNPETKPIDPDDTADEQTQQYNIKAEKVVWANGKASTTLSIKEEHKSKYKIEYQINGTNGQWVKPEEQTNGVSVGNLNHNDIIYARLTDGTKHGKYIAYIIKDKNAPQAFSINVESVLTGKFTIKAQATDNESGIEKYELYVNNNKVGEGKNTTWTVENLIQNTKYTVKVIAIDKAENRKESESKEITTKQMPGGQVAGENNPTDPSDPNAKDVTPIDPDDTVNEQGEQKIDCNIIASKVVWENEWASTTLKVKEEYKNDYKIEYKVNKTATEWTRQQDGEEEVKVDNLKHNDIIYARLTDGTNYGAYIAYIIKDKVAPNEPSIEIITGKTKENVYISYVTIQVTQGKDEESGTKCTKYKINDAEEKEITKNEKIKITEDGTYEITAYTIDKAGNKSKEVSKTIIIKIENGQWLDSDKYTINDRDMMITRISPDTTLEEFKQNISTDLKYKIKDKNEEELKQEENGEPIYITTGMTVEVEDGSIYKIVVIGDINKDGKADISDLSILKKYQIEMIELDEIEQKAADITDDEEIGIEDLSSMVKHIIELIKL